MLPLQFFSQNIHFVISLFAALVFFAVFWLYFDAWIADRRETKEIYKWFGFLLISLSFVVYATVIEQSLLGRSLLGNVSEFVSQLLRIIGYAAIVVGELIDPLQKRPDTSAVEEEVLEKISSQDTTAQAVAEHTPTRTKATKRITLPAVGWAGFTHAFHFVTPVGALAVGALYWRRATTGLERHLQPIAIAFFLLFGFELLSLTSEWSGSSNPSIAKLGAAFGLVWLIYHLLLLAAALILGKWVWQYLTKRFTSQLFMVFTSSTLAIFLATTVSFTYLLVSNVQKSALDNLTTAAGVLNYAIGTKKAQTLANSEAIAENPAIAAAAATNDHAQLASLTSNFLYKKGQSSLIITNANAEVLLRAENPDRYGDSLSSDTLVRRALIGEEGSSITAQSGVLAPQIYIRSAVPIENSQQQIVGAAMVSLVLDNAFIDGVKHSTGLNSSIYAGNTVSATSFVAADGLSRLVGVKEASPLINKFVLRQGQTYKGTVGVLNRQFLGVYMPLRDINNSIIGMMFIGQPSVTILQTAGRSIELTFLLTVVLLLLSVVPAYWMARYIAKQLE